MILYIFSITDCIAYAIYNTAIISLFPNSPSYNLNCRKNNRLNKATIICFGYFFIENFISWLTTYNKTLADISDDSLVDALSSLVYIAFLICFFYYFKDRHPVFNYTLYCIANYCWLILLALFSICRAEFFPHSRPLALAETFYDIPSLLAYILSYAAAFAVFYFCRKKLTALLLKLSQRIINAFILVTIILDMASIPFFLPNLASISSTASRYLFAMLCVITTLFILTLILIYMAFLYKYRSELLNRKLIDMSIQTSYDYYRKLNQIYLSLRHLRHDLINHMNILSVTQKDNPTHIKYRRDILSAAEKIRNQHDNLISSNIRIDTFSVYENYVLENLTNSILSICEITDVDLATKHYSNASGKEILFIQFPEKVNKAAVKRISKTDSYMLIKFFVTNHNGNIKWEEENGEWKLYISI